MVTIGFFWVNGGVYGNEGLIQAAPSAYIFALLLIVPFFYCLPAALIVAELSCAWPENGGFVVWVEEACGRTVGAHHGYWVWLIYLVDAAIYPVMLAHYLESAALPLGPTGRGCVATLVVVLVTLVNLNGVDTMVKFNSLLTVVSLAPPLFFTLGGLPRVRLAPVLRTEGRVHWSLLVSWVLWLYDGFFSLGTLAGELEHPRATFLWALAILFPGVLLMTTLPLAVALAIDPDPSHYAPGYFNSIAAQLAGGWLEGAFKVGAIVTLLGMYNASIVTAERSLAWLVEQRASAAPRGKPRHPRWAWLWAEVSGIAPCYQLLNAGLASGLVWLPYSALIQFSMLLFVPSTCLFMWAFVRLRSLWPDRPRPIAVPGGDRVAVAITLFPVAVSLLYGGIVLADGLAPPQPASEQQATRHSEAMGQLVSAALVVGGGVAVDLLMRASAASRPWLLARLPAWGRPRYDAPALE